MSIKSDIDTILPGFASLFGDRARLEFQYGVRSPGSGDRARQRNPGTELGRGARVRGHVDQINRSVYNPAAMVMRNALGRYLPLVGIYSEETSL